MAREYPLLLVPAWNTLIDHTGLSEGTKTEQSTKGKMSKRKVSRQSGEAAEPRNPILRELLREKGFEASEPEVEEAEAAPAAAEGPIDFSLAGKVVLSRERKGRGGKTVTLLSAPGLPAADLERLARALRKALGCGSTVEEGKIVVQGDIVPRVRAWLQEHGATKVVQGN